MTQVLPLTKNEKLENQLLIQTRRSSTCRKNSSRPTSIEQIPSTMRRFKSHTKFTKRILSSVSVQEKSFAVVNLSKMATKVFTVYLDVNGTLSNEGDFLMAEIEDWKYEGGSYNPGEALYFAGITFLMEDDNDYALFAGDRNGFL